MDVFIHLGHVVVITRVQFVQTRYIRHVGHLPSIFCIYTSLISYMVIVTIVSFLCALHWVTSRAPVLFLTLIPINWVNVRNKNRRAASHPHPVQSTPVESFCYSYMLCTKIV